MLQLICFWLVDQNSRKKLCFVTIYANKFQFKIPVIKQFFQLNQLVKSRTNGPPYSAFFNGNKILSNF